MNMSRASVVEGSLTRRLPPSVLLLMSAVISVILFLPYAAGYGPVRMTLGRWLSTYWADPTWQHGALAPLIAGFLVWHQRINLAALEPRPMWTGLGLSVFALFIFWIGYRGNFYYFGFGSLQLLVAGAVLWIWGWAHFKKISFAWFVLGFAWPYLFLEETLAFKLRFIMVRATSAFLNFIGVATLQDGTTLLSGATSAREQGAWFRLDVDGPCSGMRSLFALMLVSALYGYFRQRSFWRRGSIFAMSLPLAVLANMLRILLLIAASIFFGQTFAVGKGEEFTSSFHFVAGIVTFIVALAGMKTVEWLLNKYFGRERPLPLIES